MSPALGQQRDLQVFCKNSQHSWIVDTKTVIISGEDLQKLWECLTCSQSTSSFLQRHTSQYIQRERGKKNSIQSEQCIYSLSHVKQTERNMMNVRLINRSIMASIGQNCGETQCTSNINVPDQSKHRYGKSRAGRFGDTRGSLSTSLSFQEHGAEQRCRASCRSPPPMHKLWLKECKQSSALVVQVTQNCVFGFWSFYTACCLVSGDTFKIQDVETIVWSCKKKGESDNNRHGRQ